MAEKEAVKVDAAEAIGKIDSGQRVVLPLCCGLPQTLVERPSTQPGPMKCWPRRSS